jgi:hypothetical protein
MRNSQSILVKNICKQRTNIKINQPMNKVFNINLGGYPFTIDDDAYEHLKVYLKTIHNHFRDSEGYEEITSDIESRLAELFQDKLNDRPIVMLSTVQDAIALVIKESVKLKVITKQGNVFSVIQKKK